MGAAASIKLLYASSIAGLRQVGCLINITYYTIPYNNIYVLCQTV